MPRAPAPSCRRRGAAAARSLAILALLSLACDAACVHLGSVAVDVRRAEDLDSWRAEEGRDTHWLDDLPSCPCFLLRGPGGAPVVPGDERARWTTPSRGGWLSRYHPGADYEIRSAAPSRGGSGQECTYSVAGAGPGVAAILITGGTAAGTPDKVSPEPRDAAYQHYRFDVRPWEIATLLDGGAPGRHVEVIYNAVRPPNNGRQCRDNIVGRSLSDQRTYLSMTVSSVVGYVPARALLGGAGGAATPDASRAMPALEVSLGARLVPALAARGDAVVQHSVGSGAWLRSSAAPVVADVVRIGGGLDLYPIAFMQRTAAPFQLEPYLGLGAARATLTLSDRKEPLAVATTSRTQLIVKAGIDISILPWISLTAGVEYTYWTPGVYMSQSGEAGAGALAVRTATGAHGVGGSLGLRFNARP